MKKYSLTIILLILASTHLYAEDKKTTPAKKAVEAAKEVAKTPEVKEAPVPAPSVTPVVPAAVPETKESAKVAAVAAIDESEKPYGKTRGLLGPVTIGPTFTLLSVPHPFNVGLEGKFKDVIGFGGQYGFIPTLKISSVSIKMKTWDVGLKWFVFRGAFYIGSNYGQQTLSGTKADSILGQDISATVSIKTTYATPMIGWRWQWASGFFMGMEVGAQLALKSSTTISTSIDNATIKATTQYADLEKKVKDQGDKIGKISLPHVTFLRFGWLF